VHVGLLVPWAVALIGYAAYGVGGAAYGLAFAVFGLALIDQRAREEAAMAPLHHDEEQEEDRPAPDPTLVDEPAPTTTK
jgi:hypothetical protein